MVGGKAFFRGSRLGGAVDVIEIEVKSALVRSKIPGVDFVINPFIGCEHGCLYCYAGFMARYSHAHAGARWGSFVELKSDIAAILRRELAKKRKRASVLLSSVCDPYQPVEARCGLTRGCVEALRDFGWGIEILTRSPLVLRDLELLSSAGEVSVGFSIPTESEDVRRVTEPGAPSIPQRVEALRKLHEAGIRTWAFIAPLLPTDPRKLYDLIEPHVGHVLIDALNYSGQVSGLFRKKGWEYALTERYAEQTAAELVGLFGDRARRV